jgi:hypothetical protein
MVIQRNASNLPWMVDTNLSVCNMLVNVGSVTRSENTARDQTKNAICHAEKILAEPVVQAGETASLN